MTSKVPKTPQRIAVCRSSGNVAVLCGDRGVVVMESNFQQKYRYKPCETRFDPTDIEFDDAGRLLIAEKEHKSNIHVIDGNDGSSLLMIKLDNGTPLCLTSTTQQGDINIIVGTSRGELLTIRYLEKTD